MKREPNIGEPLSDLEQEVLALLRSHPDVSDDLVGITRWRLTRARIHAITSEVEEGLNRLVRLGLVLRQEQPGGRVTYQANPKTPGPSTGQGDGYAEHERNKPL